MRLVKRFERPWAQSRKFPMLVRSVSSASGANFGYRGTLPQILGINVGGFVQTYVTCLGLGALFVALPMVQTTLRVAGALQHVEGLEAWHLGQTAVALAPDFNEFSLTARGDAKTIHGDEHGVNLSRMECR